MFKIVKAIQDEGGIYIKIGQRNEIKNDGIVPLTCSKCGYQAKSAYGLKIHTAAKHK
jgi:hypothetical protein